MTPETTPIQTANKPLQLSELMKLPAFQNLLAKIETNFYRNRPNEAATLEKDGSLPSLLQERATRAWETLSEARAKGLPMFQAEELITEYVYPPLESDES